MNAVTKGFVRRAPIGAGRRPAFVVYASLCLMLGIGGFPASADASSSPAGASTDGTAASNQSPNSMNADQPLFRLGTAARPFGWSTAIGDFNSDGKPDLVVADHIGRRAGRYAYRIEFSLSGTAPDDVIFESTADALTISTVDIDHDNDLDIVLGRPQLGEAVGVWLNDGHGHFTSANVRQFPSAIGGRQSLDATDLHVDVAALDESPRPQHGHHAASQTASAETGAGAVALRPGGRSSSVPVTRSNPRAPPQQFGDA